MILACEDGKEVGLALLFLSSFMWIYRLCKCFIWAINEGIDANTEVDKTPKSNDFNDFEQRKYDFEELERDAKK